MFNRLTTNSKKQLLLMVIVSSITGIAVGMILYLFKYLTHILVEQTILIYQFIRSNPVYLPVFFLGLLTISFLIYSIVKTDPNVRGGAIGRACGVLRGLITFRWLTVALKTFVSSLLGFFAGLPVGVEGPSVILGTTIGQGVHDLTKAPESHKRYIQTAGASAGFGVATGSSLAGVIFGLEEMHKRFSFTLLISALTGSLFATLVVKTFDYIFNTGINFFPIGTLEDIPITHVWIPAILGIGAGFAAVLFNLAILKSGEFTDNKLAKVPLFVKILINIGLVGSIGLLVVQVIGSGHDLILELVDLKYSFGLVVIFLVAKLVVIVATTHSGTTGGLFVPILVLGALFGAVLNFGLIKLGLDPTYSRIIIIITMCAFFAASLGAPITTIAFMIEATLNANNVAMMIVAVFFAMVIAYLFNLEPINEVVLERILKRLDRDKKAQIYVVDGIVTETSFVSGFAARDILWPANCIIKSIRRRDNIEVAKMVKGGEKVINDGDYLSLQIQTFNIDQSIEEISSLLGKQNFQITLLS